MRLAIKNVKVVSLEDGQLRVRLVKRCNTRRNRRLAWKHLFDREEDLYFQHAPHDSARESRIRSAAWLAGHVDHGVPLKALSAVYGCSLRKLSKRLHDYRHGRLPGQKEITA